VSSYYLQLESDLEDWKEKWLPRVKLGGLDDSQSQIRQARIKIYYHYASLLVASIALQNALDHDPAYTPFALAKYQTAALALLNTFRDDVVAFHQAAYCTDFQFTYILYGAVSLLKSLQPQFRHSLISRNSAGKLVSSIAMAFEEAACTWDHLPALQAKFLRRVLKARLPDFEPTPPSISESPSFPPVAGVSPSQDHVDISQLEHFLFDSTGNEASAPNSPRAGTQGNVASFPSEAHHPTFDDLVFSNQSWGTIFEPGMCDPLNWQSFGTTGVSRCPSPTQMFF